VKFILLKQYAELVSSSLKYNKLNKSNFLS